MMTLTAAAHALGVTDKTVHRWALLAEMPLEEDPLDKRVVMIADEDVEELRRIHAPRQPSRHDLEARIEDLERRIAALERGTRRIGPVRSGEGNLTGLADTHPSTPITPPRPRQRAMLREESPLPLLPDGWVTFNAWCTAHNINPRAAQAEKEIRRGMPEVTRDVWAPISGGVPVNRAFSPEQQLAAAAYARGRWPDRWKE